MGPGPVILTAHAGYPSGLWSRLPEAARQCVAPEDQLAVRWPRHPIWDELRHADMPLITVPVNVAPSEASEWANADLVIIDAGPAQAAGPTIVRAEGRRCLAERPGGLTGNQLDDLTLCRILFICTGNTCRSPMAAGLCMKLLADHLGCEPGELRRHGFCVQSAGLAAMMGAPASPDGVRVVADLGADIASHRSAMVMLEMLLGADQIFAMTASHQYTMKGIPVPEIPEPRLLSPRQEDVIDPIGGELADYRACASHILECLRERLPELLES
jgi:protein-tyrosine-phosphatase